MKQFIFSLLICTALFAAFQAGAQISDQLDEHASAWTLSKQSNRVKVYTRAYENSNFNAFKAVATLNQPISSILAVLSDATSCPLWVDGCLRSDNLEVTNFNDRFGYSESKLPWPFKNRDLAVRILTTNPNGKHEIQIAMYTDGRLPKETGKTVHITDSESLYILRAVNNTQTDLIWMQHTEPSGNLPAWLVNSMIVNLPLKSVAALEKTASAEKYQNAKIKYDDLGQIIGLGIENM